MKYCAKVMQTIVDEYHDINYQQYLTRFYLKKIIYDNDESSSLRSQLFEMASSELNAFSVS